MSGSFLKLRPLGRGRGGSFRSGNGGGGGGGAPPMMASPPPGEDGVPWLSAALLALTTWVVATPWARRGLRFWLGVAPIISSYAGIWVGTVAAPVELRAERFTTNHELQAPRALRLVQCMAGGYIKMGQVLSNRADVLPDPYVRAFSTLQDAVPPRPWAALARTLPRDAPALAAELAWVDEMALGAASTGQVHRARLRNGSDVVLKLQYREAREFFGHDLGNVARLARLALPAMSPVVSEVRRRFQLEFDYAREARDMLECRRRCVEPRIVIPSPYLELTTERVLVMERLPGEKLLQSISKRFIEAVGEGGFAAARAQALGRPMPTNVRTPPLVQRARAAPKLWWLRRQTRGQLELLLRTLGHQIFIDGVFHADPHPGNVLLLPDGRLGLIDFGQCVRLTSRQRLLLARLILALADAPAAALTLPDPEYRPERCVERRRGRAAALDTARTVRGDAKGDCKGDDTRDHNGEHTGDEQGDAHAQAAAVEAARLRVAHAAADLGFETRHNSAAGLAATAGFFFDRDLPPDTWSNGKPRSPAQALKALDTYDQLVTVPSEFILAARVSLLMRGSSQLMAQKSVSTAAAWRADAQRVVDELETISQDERETSERESS
jgi:aarF domain-containing kinase